MRQVLFKSQEDISGAAHASRAHSEFDCKKTDVLSAHASRAHFLVVIKTASSAAHAARLHFKKSKKRQPFVQEYIYKKTLV